VFFKEGKKKEGNITLKKRSEGKSILTKKEILKLEASLDARWEKKGMAACISRMEKRSGCRLRC